MTDNNKKQLVVDWLIKSPPNCIKLRISEINVEKVNRQLLECYQGSSSKLFNEHLRIQNSNNSNIDLCVNLLCIELKTFPQYSNQIIYRNELISGEFEDFYYWFVENKNKIISFPSFLSCSKKYKWMEPFELKFKIQTIDNSNAHDICSLKPKHTEEEVLFLPQTNFKISEIKEREKLICLVETKEPATIILYQNEGLYCCANNDKDDIGRPSLSDEADDF